MENHHLINYQLVLVQFQKRNGGSSIARSNYQSAKFIRFWQKNRASQIGDKKIDLFFLGKMTGGPCNPAVQEASGNPKRFPLHPTAQPTRQTAKQPTSRRKLPQLTSTHQVPLRPLVWAPPMHRQSPAAMFCQRFW